MKKKILITGETLPEFDANSVWEKSAKVFNTDSVQFQNRIVDRSPIVILTANDEKSAEKIRAQLVAIGVETYLYSEDGPGLES